MELKNIPKSELTANELDMIAIKVCSESGIKKDGLPSKELINLCLKSWNEKFSARMNKYELQLAFEMNVNGDFEPKVNHFQCFSRDFFCDVLNRYLDKKQQAIISHNEPEIHETKEPNDYMIKLMQSLINDRMNVELGLEITKDNTINARSELLSQLFDVNVTDEEISEYRETAIRTVLTELSNRRNEARKLEKFGAEIELSNQISRIKAQKLITDNDENMIQSQVMKQIYVSNLKKWSETEFIKHVKSQM